MKSLNLFGEFQEINHKPNKKLSPYQQIKQTNKFGLAKNNVICCKFCVHLYRIQHHDKIYNKCQLIGISSSEATDIRLKNVCNKFEYDENT